MSQAQAENASEFIAAQQPAIESDEQLDSALADKLYCAFKSLAESIVKLRAAEPKDYMSILKDILLSALNDDSVARDAFINQLVELVDASHIEDCLNRIHADECSDLEKKSPFREQAEAIHKKWFFKIDNKICFPKPDPGAWWKRRVEVQKLAAALEPVATRKSPRYPDHSLVRLIDDIATKGERFTQFGFDRGFNGFLEDVTRLNKLRASGALKSYDGSYYSGQEHVRNLLVLKNARLERRLSDILDHVVEAQSKQCIDDQNSTLQLHDKLVSTDRECKTLEKQLQDERAAHARTLALCASLMVNNERKDQTIVELTGSNALLMSKLGATLSDSEGSEDDELSPDSSPSSASSTSVEISDLAGTTTRRKLYDATSSGSESELDLGLVINSRHRFDFNKGQPDSHSMSASVGRQQLIN